MGHSGKFNYKKTEFSIDVYTGLFVNIFYSKVRYNLRVISYETVLIEVDL